MTGEISAAVVRRSATIALMFCVPLSFASGVPAGAIHLSAVAAAVAYNVVVGAVLVGRHRLAWSLTIGVAGLTVSGFIVSGSTL